ncbi:hypothetical protein [Streptomyces sp. NPDC050485]|uniref:hypothetical protein n=1 Tax=Streptomyces sp. NPDC050485 TaxID=3365617 RepID=UPI0037A41937
MSCFTLPDTPEPLTLTDRPSGEDFSPLPHGLTLGDAVAVRAFQVQPGDLVVAMFSDGTGLHPTEHVPGPYPADPHTVSDCPCNGCEECDDLDSWTSAGHGRVADTGWRFACLAPAEDDEPCVIVLRNRPMAVIPAAVVAAAEAAEPPERMYGVTWSVDFDASSPEEAARLAHEQLKSYATDSLPPVLEVRGQGGRTTVIDLSNGEQTTIEPSPTYTRDQVRQAASAALARLHEFVDLGDELQSLGVGALLSLLDDPHSSYPYTGDEEEGR